MKAIANQILVFPILSALSSGYAIIVRVRLWLYAKGWLARSRLPCPVLSVGNVTVGGTGKTPTALWIAQQLMDKGLRVGILSRGYRRTSRDHFLLVSNGQTLLVNPWESGDEPFLMARRCPGLVVAVGADRYRLGKWVLQQERVDCFVLDDGFQHLSLHRDVDLVLIDGSDRHGLQRMLPAGQLREPLEGLNRATNIMVTGCDSDQKERTLKLIQEVMNKSKTNIVTSHYVVEGLVMGGEEAVRPVSSLRGEPVVIFSGIANPWKFRSTVEALDVEIVDEVVYRDHYAYTRSDLLDLVRRGHESHAQCFLTTEKDLVKIEAAWSFPQKLFAVRIGLQVCDGAEVLETCLQIIERQCKENNRTEERPPGVSV